MRIMGGDEVERMAGSVRDWVNDRRPEHHRLMPTALLIGLSGMGALILWLGLLPRELNLFISGLLFVAFILWPLTFGYLGSIVSAAYLLSGAVFTVRAWLIQDDPYFLSIAVFQVATVVSGVIIASLVERDRKRRRELERAATVDGLTGLYNHKHFVHRLQQELARRQRNDDEIALMYIDLDNFKPINDTYGHQRGDIYLRAFSQLLVDVLRADDTAYRLGGDEFAVILPGTAEEGAQRVAERLRKEMARRQLGLPDGASSPSASIGISVAPRFADSATELMTQADSALYHAKNSGRDQIRLFQDLFAEILAYFTSGSEELIWSLKSLLWSASARDHYTYGHSERVSDYAAAIAAECGLTPEEVSSVRIAAVLHDIGRVQIAQDILLKPGPLTAEECEEVRRHPEYAAAILKPLAGMGTVLEDVRHHHEHFDGSGYPSRLAGRDIPIGARIIAIADAFDAMCTDRPYRAAMPLSRAIAEIRKASGTAFDPEIASVALQILPQLSRGSEGRVMQGLKAV